MRSSTSLRVSEVTAAVKVDKIAPGIFAYENNTAAAYALRLENDRKQTVLSVRDAIVLDELGVANLVLTVGNVSSNTTSVDIR